MAGGLAAYIDMMTTVHVNALHVPRAAPWDHLSHQLALCFALVPLLCTSAVLHSLYVLTGNLRAVQANTLPRMWQDTCASQRTSTGWC
jgi:hypothetical protein